MVGSRKRKLVFMGSDEIALPSLEFLAEQTDALEIAAVYTQPDRRRGRGKALHPNAIKVWAQEREIAVRQPEKLGDGEVEWLQENGIDLILVMAYGHILRRNLIESVPLKTYNLHASLLPKYRGASPIEAAISEGDEETGVTLMQVVRRLDAGPLVDAERFPIDRLETGESAKDKMAQASVAVLKRNLSAMLAGTVEVKEQDEALATYTRKLKKEDGVIDFSVPAKALADRINALMPWPGSFLVMNDQPIKIGSADSIDETADAEPGTILDCSEQGLRVATAKGTLRLLSLQRPGGRLLQAEEFLRGFPIEIGTILESESMAPLVSKEPFPYRRRG